ncbi:MAG: hypothetical protein LUQ31_00475 [Methanoregula sp.]|nr:hypothetical protein [Methanoregula sp.]
MSFVWNRRLSKEVRLLGYDIVTGVLIVELRDGVKRYYSPVTWDMYAAISHASFPEHLYRSMIEGKVPALPGLA